MNRRFFIKSLLFFLSSISFKIFPQNKKQVSFDHSVASGDPTNSHIILWTKITANNLIDVEVD